MEIDSESLKKKEEEKEKRKEEKKKERNMTTRKYKITIKNKKMFFWIFGWIK